MGWKSLIDLNVRERFHINIIGIKQGENVTVDLKPSEPLPDRCSIIAIGKIRISMRNQRL